MKKQERIDMIGELKKRIDNLYADESITSFIMIFRNQRREIRRIH
jgi:hypothetical protein